MARHNEQGFAQLIVVAVVVIAFLAAGVMAYRMVSAPTTAAASSTTFKQIPQSIKNKQDLQKAASALDSTSVDNNVQPDQLNEDISSML